MRLYRTTAGEWTGTQDEARKLAGKAWETVEVPTDKAGLLAFLNREAEETFKGITAMAEVAARKPQESTERLEAPPVSTRTEAPQERPAAPNKVQHAIKVEEEIAGADLPQTIRLADHVMWRLNEHVRAAERNAA